MMNNCSSTQTDKDQEPNTSLPLFNRNLSQEEILKEHVIIQEITSAEQIQKIENGVSLVQEQKTSVIREDKTSHIGEEEGKSNALAETLKQNEDYVEEFKTKISSEMLTQVTKTLGEVTLKDDVFRRITRNTDPLVTAAIDAIFPCSHIVVLTGAGLSAASNIPTFRGEGGFWTLRNQQNKLKASKFLTHRFFEENPSEIWRWHNEFRKLASKNSPNVSHHAIADFQVFCKQTNRKFTLVTQNVDGYHIEAYVKAAAKNGLVSLDPDGPKVPEQLMKNKFGICDDVYEIHGSAAYMRCDQDCTFDLFPSPELGCADDFVDTCPNCNGIARPHTLFFDERYDEHYYRRDTLMKEIKTMDCLIVIGTALETNLASTIVEQAFNENKLVVEINPKPLLEEDNVINLVGGAEKFVPDLFEGVKKKILENI